VIQQSDVERGFQAARDELIADDRGGVVPQRGLDDFARMHAGPIDRAAKEVLARDRTMSLIE
jgi:hypothetical protein